jgi:uncharacterized protein
LPTGLARYHAGGAGGSRWSPGSPAPGRIETHVHGCRAEGENDVRSIRSAARPLVGIGFRLPIARWICDNLNLFDVLEITVDHYINAGDRSRAIFSDLVGRIPLIAHGVGLSIGTDVPLDDAYLDKVARAIDDLRMPSYSEHLAWTRTPGIELSNLLPLPKNEQVAASIVEKVKIVQSRIPVPFALENISYLFDFPDSTLDDAAFFNMISEATGAQLLLDVENLYVNSRNHRFDPNAFLGALAPGVVAGLHVAGGPVVSRNYLEHPIWLDSHSEPVADPVLDLLDRVLDDHEPETIVLERDENLENLDEISDDVGRIRSCVDARYEEVRAHAEPNAVGPPS